MVVTDCLYDPLAMVNLVSVKQLNNAGYCTLFLPDEDSSGLITPPQHWLDGHPCRTRPRSSCRCPESSLVEH
eukprot:1409476-Rhodomonas_salina.1